jgi:hypothetical protein
MCLELSTLKTTVNSLKFPIISKVKKKLYEIIDEVKCRRRSEIVKLHERICRRSEIKAKQSEIVRRKDIQFFEQSRENERSFCRAMVLTACQNTPPTDFWVNFFSSQFELFCWQIPKNFAVWLNQAELLLLVNSKFFAAWMNKIRLI